MPYYGAEKSTDEIRQILIDAYLNPDEDLLELADNLPNYYNDAEEIVIIEDEKNLEIDNILNLDEFAKTLEDIIEDSNVEGVEAPMEEIQEKNDDIIWIQLLKRMK